MSAKQSLDDILAEHSGPGRGSSTRSAPLSDRDTAEKRHIYSDPRTGERVIGVTTVVGCYDSGDKIGAGAGAAAKLLRAGVDYRRQWNEKKDLGSRIHEHVAKWAEGKTADVLEEDMGHMDAFENFCRAEKPEWIATERAVVGNGFGGKLDLIAWLPNRESYWLLDAKSGRPYKAELLLQLAGYAGSDGFIVYDETGKAVGIEPLPPIERWGGLYLSGDGTYFLSEPDLPTKKGDTRTIIEVQEDAKSAFRHLLAVKAWSKTVGKD
jgi:hypothetical protein